MPLEIVLVVPRRRFIANRSGIGYQLPLGMVLLGGPLAGAGQRVRLIDNDAMGHDLDRLADEVGRRTPDCILLGHSGSTAAHPVAMETARALRRRFPRALLVYGGPYPSSAPAAVLTENPEIDVVVRGEGEETVGELAEVVARGGRRDRVRGGT